MRDMKQIVIILFFTSWRQNPWLWRTTALLATTPSWSAKKKNTRDK